MATGATAVAGINLYRLRGSDATGMRSAQLSQTLLYNWYCRRPSEQSDVNSRRCVPWRFIFASATVMRLPLMALGEKSCWSYAGLLNY